MRTCTRISKALAIELDYFHELEGDMCSCSTDDAIDVFEIAVGFMARSRSGTQSSRTQEQ